MNEKQIVAMIVGVLAVVLFLLAYADINTSGNYDQVASGVAGVSAVIVIFALVVGSIALAIRGRG